MTFPTIQEYDTKAKFASYWHQINEIVSLNPKTILEIGIGYGLVANYLRKNHNLNVTTLDTNSELNPDITASLFTMGSEKYEAVACFQVLEHFPKTSLKEALQCLKNVTTKYILISLPDRRKKIKISFPLFKEKTIRLPINRRKIEKTHHWEIENLTEIRNSFLECDLTIIKEYPIYETDNRMFVLMVGGFK